MLVSSERSLLFEGAVGDEGALSITRGEGEGGEDASG